MMPTLAELDARAEHVRPAVGMAVNALTAYYGVDIGEFAFSVMSAAVWRKDVETCHWQRAIVCSRPDRKALFADFCTDFIGHDIDCHGDCTRARPMPPAAELAKWLPTGGCQVVQPRDYGDKTWPGHYIVYGNVRPEWAGAVVIHARSRPYCEWRNWPVRNWHKIGRFLRRMFPGKRLVCMGTRLHALGVEGAADMRGADLQTQMDITHTAGATGGFCLGESSGAMHLAEHCGCPVLVWCGGDDGEMERTTRWYRETWNPHHVFARAYRRGDWQPPVEQVQDWIRDFAKERGM